MSGPHRPIRTAATFGIILGGPATFFLGIGVLGTLPTGIPRFLIGVFMLAVALTVVSVLAFLAEDAAARSRPVDDLPPPLSPDPRPGDD